MKIRLLPSNPDYAELFYQWRNESNTVKYNLVMNLSLEEVRSSLVKAPASLNPLVEGITYRWFVERQGKIVATVSLAGVNLMMGYGEIGYTVGEIHQGCGIASMALKLWTTTLFEMTPLRKLTASVAENNKASLRVLEKAGFKKEGILRDHYLIHGIPVSQIVFGILRSELSENHAIKI